MPKQPSGGSSPGESAVRYHVAPSRLMLTLNATVFPHSFAVISPSPAFAGGSSTAAGVDAGIAADALGSADGVDDATAAGLDGGVEDPPHPHHPHGNTSSAIELT